MFGGAVYAGQQQVAGTLPGEPSYRLVVIAMLQDRSYDFIQEAMSIYREWRAEGEEPVVGYAYLGSQPLSAAHLRSELETVLGLLELGQADLHILEKPFTSEDWFRRKAAREQRRNDARALDDLLTESA